MQATLSRPPSGLNDATRGRSSVKSGLRAATLFNLDSTDTRLVKKGCIVTWQAFRYRVDKVRTGTAYITQLDAFGHPKQSGLSWLECHRLTVVS